MHKHPLVRPSTHTESTPEFANDVALKRLEGRRKRNFGTKHISASLPFIADVRNGTSYAAWRVWSGSTKGDVRFVPMPKKTCGSLKVDVVTE